MGFPFNSTSHLTNFTITQEYDGIELRNFSRDDFMQVMVVYAAPCAIALLCGTAALFHSRFHLGLLPAWILRDWLGMAVGTDEDESEQVKSLAAGTGPIAENADQTFEFYLAWIHPSAMFLVILVPFSIIVFFVAALLLLDRMFAVAMAFIFFLAMILAWTMMRWKFEAWRFTFKVKLLFGFAVATTIAFELYKCYYARPYEFIGLGVFCLMCNMLGMIRLTYYIRGFKDLQFDKYLSITEPVLQDLKKQEALAAVKAEQAKKLAIEKRKAESAAKRKQQIAAMKAAIGAAVTDEDSKEDTSMEDVKDDPESAHTDDEPPIESPSWLPAGIDVSQLASTKYFQTRLSMPRAMFSYFRALLALAGFAVIIDRTGFGVIGYITAAAIVWMDGVVLLWMYGQAESTPLLACILLSGVRFFLIIFGPTYYLVGHTCLFVLLSCYFSYRLIDRFAPISKLRQKTDDEEEIIPEGFAPPIVQPATAVIQEPTGTPATREAAARRLRREQRLAAHNPTVNTSLTQVLALICLIIAFVFDTVLNYYIDEHTTIPSGIYTYSQQSIIGFFGMCIFVCFTLGKLTFRIYVNQQYKSHGYPLFISFLHYVFILGAGALYYYVVEEKNVPSLCIFLPPIVFFLIGLYSQWVKNDFHIILPKFHRNPPKSSCCEAFMRCGFPGNDYFMVAGMSITIALIILLGFALSWYITPWWIGAIVSWVLVVLITTITPMIEYFHTFEFSLNMYCMTGISFCSYFIGLVCIYVIVLEKASNHESFILLLAAFLYPILILFTVGISKWRDDEWVISDFVVWTNFIGGMLLILLFFSIALVFTPWWIGGGFLFVFIVLLLAIMILPKIKELSPIWYKLICTASVILMFGFVIGATLNDSSGFIGFTVLCGISLLAMLGVVYYAYKGSPYDNISIHKHKLILYNEHIFPIYEFDTMAKGKGVNPITEVNHRVWSIYAIFGICYIWGVFSLFFQSPTTVGLCVSSLALTAAMIFTSELMYRASVRSAKLAECVDYLEEGSELYDTTLAHCKWIATKNQLLNDTSLFLSTKQNRLALDIGIQTDALTPGSLESKTQEIIIQHLEFIYMKQNWELTYQRYEGLNKSLAKMTCCGLRDDFELSFEGRLITRREAFRLCDELFLSSAQFYKRKEFYELNIQQELIKSVEGKKYDRFTQIIAMLREKGNFVITMEYLQGLSPLSKEMQEYEIECDFWLEKRAKLLAELARVKAERDEDQRRRDALAVLAAEHMKQLAEQQAAEDLRRKHEEMLAAEQAKKDEAERLKKQQAEELAEFERQQALALEEEQARIEADRQREIDEKSHAGKELARQKRIAEKRREEKEIADGLRAAAEAAMAAKEQEELARLRRKAEQRKKELEHARLLAEKKAKLKAESEMKAKMAELEAKHQAELARVQSEQAEEQSRRKKLEEESANLQAIKAEVEARRLQHEQELAELKRQMEEQAERMRKEKEQLAADRAAQAAELAALASAEAAARDRAAAVAAAEAQRRREEQSKREAEEEEEQQRARDMQEQEEKNKQAELDREQQKAKKRAELEEAKQKKLAQLEAKRADKEAAELAKQQKAMTALVAQAKQDQCCTYKLTNQQLSFQEYWSCATCDDAKGGECFCFACAESCHAGHEITKVGTAACFCDCGHSKATCNMMKSPAEQKAAKAKQQVTGDHSVQDEAGTLAIDEAAEHPCLEILRECKARGTTWTDPDFPHDDTALFGGADPVHPEWSGTKWARIKDIVKEPTVFLPPIDANDIRQGSLGNCWFMSACAVLTQKPEALMAVFVTREYNPEGVYGLRFFKNGKVANVTVDDWLPIQQRGPNQVDTLFAKPKDAKAVWVMLIEKAFAKLHKSYQNIEGGWIDDALVDLAGGVADRIRWTDEKTKTAIHDGSLWTMLLKYHQQGYLLGCGSPVGASDSEEDASPWGIVQSHAYSILGLVAVDGIQLINVRNPWGRHEWSGDWGDKSPLWTRRMKSKVNYVDREDGAFWMSWQDFCINFDEVYIARFFAENIWVSRGKVFGEWKGPTAGGCVNHETVKDNVQYGLTILEPGPCEVSVSLLLEDVRGVEGKQVGDFPTVILEIYDHSGKPINRRERGQQLATACDNLQEIFVECQIQSDGAKTYTILPCCFEPGVETSYTLRWHTTKRAKLQQFQAANTADQVIETRRR